MDAKYEGDEGTRKVYGPIRNLSQEMSDYYKNNDARVQEEVKEILFQYVKDNFSYEEKLKVIRRL